MKVIGYARRSRERGNGEYGLDDQEARIRAWADYRGHDLADVLREDGVSGATRPEERPKLGPVLASLGRGDVLVVARLDRLSRSVYDFARLMREATAGGWSLVCLDPELDLTTAAGRMAANVFAAFAEFEKDLLVERLQGARRRKAARGGYAGGHRIHRRYGYELRELPDGRAEYVPVADEQDTIREMRRLRAKHGMSLSAVCAALADQGRPGPTGGEWSPPTVKRILDREVA